MSRSRIILLSLIAVLALLTAACTPQEPEVSIDDQVAADDRAEESPAGGDAAGGEAAGGDAAEGEVIEWAAGNELAYSEAPETVPADTQLTFELTLEGLPHDVTIEDLNGDETVVAGTSEGTYTGQVTLPAGEYTYYCSVPGHRAGGMEGTLTAA